MELPVLFPGWSGPRTPSLSVCPLNSQTSITTGHGRGVTWRGSGMEDGQQLASLAPSGQASKFPGAGRVIKDRLSGRAHQLPGDLGGCLMSSNTMSVTTFALSAPLEDGANSKEENVFKIEALASSARPLAFPATSRLRLEAWRWLFSFYS